MTNSKNFAIVTTVALLASRAESFGISTSTSKSHQPLTSLSAQNDSRRNFLRSAAGLAFGTVAFTSNEEPASASYSAYTNREKDWEERKKTGEIEFSTPRNLKAQLVEIAPMNNEKSKVFCPNGTSSAVSPLMENKCGDRMAMPSVYGRTEDTVGNSIPGFKGGRYSSVGGSSSLSADTGGFPKY